MCVWVPKEVKFPSLAAVGETSVDGSSLTEPQIGL